MPTVEPGFFSPRLLAALWWEEPEEVVVLDPIGLVERTDHVVGNVEHTDHVTLVGA